MVIEISNTLKNENKGTRTTKEVTLSQFRYDILRTYIECTYIHKHT